MKKLALLFVVLFTSSVVYGIPIPKVKGVKLSVDKEAIKQQVNEEIEKKTTEVKAEVKEEVNKAIDDGIAGAKKELEKVIPIEVKEDSKNEAIMETITPKNEAIKKPIVLVKKPKTDKKNPVKSPVSQMAQNSPKTETPIKKWYDSKSLWAGISALLTIIVGLFVAYWNRKK